MTNGGVNPEHGLQYGQTTVPSRVCIFLEGVIPSMNCSLTQFVFSIVGRPPVFITV